MIAEDLFDIRLADAVLEHPLFEAVDDHARLDLFANCAVNGLNEPLGMAQARDRHFRNEEQLV